MDTGNTFITKKPYNGKPVHPRGYGEHIPANSDIFIFTGSSPWIRGTLTVLFTATDSVRFIPVDTGNTVITTCGLITFPVHPRGYGEHS